MTDVAIVIPTLNRAELLVRSISSALECAPAELVVADCGSRDDTEKVVASFGTKVRLIRSTVPSAASARNLGARNSAAPLVGFLDSDDEALPGKTHELVQHLDENPATVMVHGLTTVIDGANNEVDGETRLHAIGVARAQELGTSYAALAAHCSMYTSATLIRRDAFEAVGGYDESFATYEDWDLYLRLSLIGSIDYLAVPAARYRVWPGNVAWDRTATGVAEVSEKHLSRLYSVPIEQRLEAHFNLLARLAGARYTLLELPAARRAAFYALRMSPGRAVRSKEIRRAATRWIVPKPILRLRRPIGTTS